MINEQANQIPGVVAVTLNPAIDRTVFVERLIPGQVHRVRATHSQAGGKGVNVATMLALGGTDAAVSGFLGADNADVFVSHFQRYGLQDHHLRIAGETRTGIKIVAEGSKETTDLNSPGLAPRAKECDALLQRLADLAQPGAWCVFAGSLPPAMAPDFLGRLIRAVKAKGARVAADTSGPALTTAVETGVDLAKPNEHELSELLGREFADFSDLLRGARELQKTVPHLVVSLGGKGALFLTPEQELMASAPPVSVVSTVGAGDSLLAGYLQGLLRGYQPAERARLATVYAWSRLEALVPSLPEGEDLAERLRRVEVRGLSA